MFALDSSGSIGADNWPKVRNFVKRVVSGLDIGRHATRVGALTYGNFPELNFHLNAFTTVDEITAAIDEIQWKDEETNTSGAIGFMRESMFRRENGDRPNAPNLGIVVTDGESNRDRGLVAPYSRLAKLAGITMFAIGIGDKVNQSELVSIASTKDNQTFVFNVDSFDTLDTINNQIVGAACDIPAGNY